MIAQAIAILISVDAGVSALPDTLHSQSLEDFVITATRTPKSLKDVPVVTQLITSSDIGHSDALNVKGLLTDYIPGLEFSYAMSQEQVLSMNGFSGNSILFLVDGEPLAGETMDNVDYNRLSLSNVRRVEIVKGAASALYGSNAVGGVINLITADPGTPWEVSLNSGYSALGEEWRGDCDVNLHSGKWSSNTNLQYSTSKTVRLADAFDTQSNLQYLYGGNCLNLQEKIIFQPSGKVKVIAKGGYFDRMSKRINYNDRYLDYNGGIRGTWIFDSLQSLEISYSYDQYDKQRYINSIPTHDHDYSNRKNTIHALYNHYIGADAIIVGSDFTHDYLKTYQFTDNGMRSQINLDAFAQYDFNRISWLNAMFSLRDDYYSASGYNALTARASVMFKLPKVSFRLNYSGGFRAPSLKEMYMDFDMAGIQMIYGNPDLKSERSHNLNLAVEHSGQFYGSYNITYMSYYNWYNNRIITTDLDSVVGGLPALIYCNEPDVRIYGVDISAKYKSIYGIGLSLNYNWLHTRGNSMQSLFSQPRPHSLTCKIEYEHRFSKYYNIYASLSGRYLSRPYTTMPTDGAYSVWKLTLQQEIWKGIILNFTLDNLFNYRPKIYYWNSLPTLGRTWSLGLNLNINKLLI